jgi:predicted RNA-binding Zn-ribbon protein involved in translation (DUF1610 family)
MRRLKLSSNLQTKLEFRKGEQMSCRYKNECPSYSGWCEGPKQDFSKCVQFLIPAYENIKKQLDECRDVREKQISKKVVRKIQKEDITIGRIKFAKGTRSYWCPNCDKAITGTDHRCRYCGQKIKF